jgi:hypothetical protein
MNSGVGYGRKTNRDYLMVPVIALPVHRSAEIRLREEKSDQWIVRVGLEGA